MSDKTKPRYLSSEHPVIPEKYKTRESYILRIHQLLKERSRVILVGMGGIGKTVIAAEYFSRFEDQYSNLVWCNCGEGVMMGMLKDISHSMLGISIKEQEGEVEGFGKNYKELLLALKNLDGRNLLVLDSVSSEEININITSHLIQWDTIISTRSNKGSEELSIRVDALEPKEAKELFFDHYKREDDSKSIDELLKDIEYLTLAIELLAKNLEGLPAGLDIEWLHGEIRKKGILNVPSGTVFTDYNKEETKFDKIIQTVFDVSRLEPRLLDYLMAMAVLPSIPIALKTIGNLLTIDISDITSPEFLELSDCLNQLHYKGWLEKEYRKKEKEYYYRLHQLVGESIRRAYEKLGKGNLGINLSIGRSGRKSIFEFLDGINLSIGRGLLRKIKTTPKTKLEVIDEFPFVEAYVNTLNVEGATMTEGELCLGHSAALRDIGENKKALQIGEKGREIMASILIDFPTLIDSEKAIITLQYKVLITTCEELKDWERMGKYINELSLYL